MAFNPLMVLWLDMLAERGVFDGANSVIEMGPQTVMPSCYDALRLTAERRAGADADKFMRKMFPFGDANPASDGQKALYALFGLTDYHSIDYFDAQATYAYDLNYPINTSHSYAVVTNMGTAEHCFNVAANFETAHNLCAPGGVILYVLPAMGDIDHGFYNIHPMLYGRLAQANNYEVVDVRYVDHLYLRSVLLSENPAAGFDFDDLPINVVDMLSRSNFARKVSLRFLENIVSEDTQTKVIPLGQSLASIVFDYCFVAVRRTSDAPFIRPMQMVEAEESWSLDFVSPATIPPGGSRPLSRYA